MQAVSATAEAAIAGAVFGLALLCLATLRRLDRLAASAAERGAESATRAQDDTSRAERTRQMLLGAERALSTRIGDVRHAMEYRLGELTARLVRDQAETRVQMEAKLREMAESQASALAAIRASVNEQLHEAVERQMQTSFARVLEHFAAVQQAVGDVQAVAGQIGDLKRVFSNVKARGLWGEA